MTDQPQGSPTVTAALVVIGEEILSGRTSDLNIAYIAAYLTRVGISLREVRVVADVEAEIVAAVNELRPRFSYVFTTGGIGPTHDDVTTDAIAKAFAVEVVVDPDAVAAMRRRFSGNELTPARLRMARVPKGAQLIDNAISSAPGFMLENVIVLAGVPRIMQVMLDAVIARLAKGRPMLARSVRLDVPEGDAAPGLAELQAAHPRRADRQLPVLRQQASRHLCGAALDRCGQARRFGRRAVDIYSPKRASPPRQPTTNEHFSKNANHPCGARGNSLVDGLLMRARSQEWR